VQFPVSAVGWLYSRDSVLTVLVHACGPFPVRRCGSGISGVDLGLWRSTHSLAGGWWGGDIGPLAGLCVRGGRRLDR
jgi:hypothetical protein